MVGRTRVKAALFVSSALAFGCHGVAQAQNAAAQPSTAAAPADPASVGEIVVTAQFRSQRLQDTPIAITAISGAMLQARSQTNLADIANQAPSVTLKSQSAVYGPALGANIRGIGQYDTNPALEPGVGLYVDDVYYATLTGSVLDLLDLDRVEILRGPQGTLSGRNSIGGSIKLYSKKPTGEGGYASVTYGSRNRLELRASLDFKLTDYLFARIAGVSKKQNGYIDRVDFACVNPPGSALNPAVGGILPQKSAGSNCVVAHDGGVDTQAVRGQLRFDNGGPIEINLAGDYTKQDQPPAGEILRQASSSATWLGGAGVPIPFDNRFLCGKWCNYANYYGAGGTWTGPIAPGYPVVEDRLDPTSHFQGWGVSGQIDWNLTDRYKLTSITAYRAYKSSFGNDNDLTPLPNSAQQIDLDFWSVTQELRLNGSIGKLIDFTIGGFYLKQHTLSGAFEDLRFTPFPFQAQSNDPVNAGNQAGFGQVIVKPLDHLRLIGGLRYSHEYKSFGFTERNRDGTLNPFLNPVGNPIDGKSETYRGNRLDYRAALQYDFTPDIMGYTQVATGFKGGGVNPRPFTVFQVVPFSPEKVTSFEAGLKTELFDRRVRLNVAAFRSNYDAIQLTLLSCPQFSDPTTTADDNGPCQATANAGDAHITGFEAETTIKPLPGFTIDGSMSYTKFKYTYLDPSAGGPTNLAGPQYDDVAPYTPKWKWSIGVEYAIDLGNKGTLTPRFDASYQSVAFSGSNNTIYERIPAYTIANARLTWNDKGRDLQVSAEVTNLFNKYYFQTVFDNTASAGYATAQPGRPREWALTVRKSF
jgi:iron complex outermembrane receptor protein